MFDCLLSGWPNLGRLFLGAEFTCLPGGSEQARCMHAPGTSEQAQEEPFINIGPRQLVDGQQNVPRLVQFSRPSIRFCVRRRRSGTCDRLPHRAEVLSRFEQLRETPDLWVASLLR